MLTFLLISYVTSFESLPSLEDHPLEEYFNEFVAFTEENILKYLVNFKSFAADGVLRKRFFDSLIPELNDYQNDFNELWENIYNSINDFKIDLTLLNFLMKYDSSTNYKSIFEKTASKLNKLNDKIFDEPIIEIFPELQEVVKLIKKDILPNMADIGMFVPALSLNSTWVENAVNLFIKEETTFNDIAKYFGIDSKTFLDATKTVNKILTAKDFTVRDILEYVGIDSSSIDKLQQQAIKYFQSNIIKIDETVDLFEQIFLTLNSTLFDFGEYIYNSIDNTFNPLESPFNETYVSFRDRIEYIRWGLSALENMPSIDDDVIHYITKIHNYIDQFATTGLNVTKLIADAVGEEKAKLIVDFAYGVVSGNENIFITAKTLLDIIGYGDYKQYIDQALDAINFYTNSHTTLKSYAEKFGFIDIYNLIHDTLKDSLNPNVNFYDIKVFKEYGLSKDLDEAWINIQQFTKELMKETYTLNKLVSSDFTADNEEILDIISSKVSPTKYFQSTYDLITEYIKKVYVVVDKVYNTLQQNPTARDAFLTIIEAVDLKQEWKDQAQEFITNINSSLYSFISDTVEPELQANFTDWIFTILTQAHSSFRESQNLKDLYLKLTSIPFFTLLNQTAMNAIDYAEMLTDVNYTMIFEEIIYPKVEELEIDIDRINSVVTGVCEAILNVKNETIIELVFGNETAEKIYEIREYIVIAKDIIDSVRNGSIISYLFDMLDIQFNEDEANSFIENITKAADSYLEFGKSTDLGAYLFGNAERGIFSKVIRVINETIFLLPRLPETSYKDINEAFAEILKVTDKFAGKFTLQDILDQLGIKISTSNIFDKWDSIIDEIRELVQSISHKSNVYIIIDNIIEIIEPSVSTKLSSIIADNKIIYYASKIVNISLFIIDLDFDDPIFGDSITFRDIQKYVQDFYDIYKALYDSYMTKDIKPFDDYLGQYGFSRTQIFTRLRTNISYAIQKAKEFSLFDYIPYQDVKDIVEFTYLHIIGQLNDFVTKYGYFYVKDLIEFIDDEDFNKYKQCIIDALQFLDRKTPFKKCIEHLQFDFVDVPGTLNAFNRIAIPSISALSTFIVVTDNKQASKKLLEDNANDSFSVNTIYDILPLNRIPELLEKSDEIVNEYSLNTIISDIFEFNISTIYTNITSNNFTVQTFILEEAPFINKGFFRALTPILEQIKLGNPITSEFVEEAFKDYDPLPFPDEEPSGNNDDTTPTIPENDSSRNTTIYIVIGVVIGVVAIVIVIVVIIVIRIKKRKAEKSSDPIDVVEQSLI